ncbi:MAG: 30S ribosomal protein S17 [Erysipelotrichaceae bacterium]
MERSNRKVLRGKVVSDKMDKTITVEISTSKSHPLYSKRIKYSKKFKAHDENNAAKIGDIVEIMETRPLSKDKRFRLVSIIEEAIIL